MSFSGDDRAVVIQIGAVLLLAAIVIAMAGYQATVVPDQNKEVEFNHNQEVQNQLQDLRNGIVSTSGGSGGSAHSVTMGTTYPPRTMFVNPNSPSGQLRTLGTGRVVIENATATRGGSVGQYWNGTNRTLDTTAFAYRPNYNELKSAPATVYEHSLLYNAHPTGANTTVADQVLVDGDEITLVTLEGELQESTSGTVSVNVRRKSGSDNTVTVTNDGGPIRIRVPTKSPDAWNESLPSHANITDTTSAGGYTIATITLDPAAYGSYDLQMARAKIGGASGGASADPEPEYVVVLDDGGPVVAEVRDRFNNPVTNATVQYETDSGSGSASTDERGRVEIPADDGETVEGWINASSYGDAAEYERFSVAVPTSGGGGSGSSAYQIDWADPTTNSSNDGLALSSCSSDSCIWDVGASNSDVLALDGYANDNLDNVDVDFRVNNNTVGAVDPGSTTDTGDGHVWTELTAKANGTVGVYVLSSGSSDKIDITVENMSGGGGGGSTNSPPTADFTYTCSGTSCTFDSTSTDSDGTVEYYEWDFDGDGTVERNTTSATTTYDYANGPGPGTYDVTHTAVDNDSATDSVTKTVSTGGGIVYNGDAAAFRGSGMKNSVVSLTFDSTRNDEVTITDVKINETSSRLDLDDVNGPSSAHEIYVDVGDNGTSPDDGYADGPGYALPATISLGNDGTVANVSGGETSGIRFYEFLKSQNGKPVDMGKESFRATVYYEVNGEIYRSSFFVNP